MPQSLHQKYGHLIFSTKNREPLITGDIEPRLFEYIGGIIRGAKAILLAIDGTEDHVHLVIRESKSIADQNFIGRLKGDSSRWVNQTMDLESPFAWQAGYGWFSVGPADLEKVINYVKGQKQHHQKVTFQEEYRKFLKQYNVEYDEAYVWD
jgi:REP element-mobilizing transposase RayT